MNMDIDLDSSSSSSKSPSPAPPPTLPSVSATKPKLNTLTPTDHITILNQIDTSISTLLQSASAATNILANQPTGSNSSSSSLTAAKEAFTVAASSYFTTLSSIEVRLRREVYALEEAGLIQAGDERDTRRGRTLHGEDGALLRRGVGGGPLDPSWLNARIGDRVEMGKKREVLAQARELLETMKITGGNGRANADVDTDMDMGATEKG